MTWHCLGCQASPKPSRWVSTLRLLWTLSSAHVGTAPDTVLGFLPTSLQLPRVFTQEAFSMLFYLFLSQTALQFEIVFPVLNFTIPPRYQNISRRRTRLIRSLPHDQGLQALK